MDSRTIKALEFGKVLEHLAGLCVSEAGRRVSLGLFPLRDADAVNAAHTLFDEVRTWSAHSGFRLSDFPDLEGLFPHLEKAAVSPSSAPLDADALWALRETLRQGRKAAQSINENGAMWPSLRDLVASMPLPEMTLSALSRCLGDDGLIKDESSPELMLVRGELRRLHLMCLRKVKDFAVQYNIAQYLQDDYMTLASDRYVLPLKSNFKGRIQGIIHDYSNTGETCYFEPLFLVEQNNRLQELKREEREEERKVLRYLTGIVQNELPFIRSAWDLLVRLDVELAKCGLAALFDGACATISPDGEDAPLSLLGARHPLLALDPQIRKQGGPHPVDLIFRPTDRALVISGGNAGGKTVCLKTLGLLAIMTLAGLPVPAAKGSVIPWWTSIHAFIGDEQSLDDHLSTFTAQIRHLGNAWEATDRRTLILLDEFGAGTELVEQDERAAIRGFPCVAEMPDLRRKRGKMIIKALLVADERVDRRPPRDDGTLRRRDRQSGERHDRQQTERLEAYGLAARVAAADDERAIRGPENEVHRMRAALLADLRIEREKRVTRAEQG